MRTFFFSSANDSGMFSLRNRLELFGDEKMYLVLFVLYFFFSSAIISFSLKGKADSEIEDMENLLIFLSTHLTVQSNSKLFPLAFSVTVE